MDTVNFFSLFKLRKSGTVVRPSFAQLMAAAPRWNFNVEVWDRPRHNPNYYGKAKFIDYRDPSNTVTREGLGYLIGCAFQVTSPASKKTNFFVTQSKAATWSPTGDGTMTASVPAGAGGAFGEIVMVTDVSQTVRPTLTLGAVSTGANLTSADNSASKAVFNHLTSITVYGLALFSVNVAGTSSGYTGKPLLN